MAVPVAAIKRIHNWASARLIPDSLLGKRDRALLLVGFTVQDGDPAILQLDGGLRKSYIT
jgi:hypothetical protein